MRKFTGVIIAFSFVFAGLLTNPAVADLDNTAAVSGLTDNYLSLNGSNQGIESTSTNYMGGNTNATVEGWILPADTMTSTTGTFFIHQDSFSYDIVNLQLKATYANPGWKSQISTGVYVRPNEWQHIAYVKSGTTLYIYLNAVLQYQLTDSTNVPSTIATTTNYTAIGGNPWNGSSNQPSPQMNFVSGGLDEIKVWTTARTAAEIKTDMHTKTAVPTSGFVGYWDFNGTTSTTIHDRTSLLDMTAYQSPTYPDVKQVTVSGGSTVISFPRTYLNGVGGWKVPNGFTTIDVLSVGGGGGGGSNVGAGGAGGGAYYLDDYGVSVGSVIPIRVGMGGAGGRITSPGTDGFTTDGTDRANGQQGDSSTVVIGGNTYLGGGGGGGHTYWSGNLCGSGSASTVWNSAGTYSGSGGTGYTGGLGGTPSSTQATANGATGYSHSITGSASYYGSGGGAGGGYNSTVAGTGANTKGGNGNATSAGAGYFGSVTSGAGGGGGATSCGTGGGGGSGVVLISYPNASAIASTLTSAVYRTSTSLTVTTSVAGKVTFYAMGKRIAGCINIPTSGSDPITATCAWKPAVMGYNKPYAVIAPTISPSYSRTVSFNNVYVTKRTNTR